MGAIHATGPSQYPMPQTASSTPKASPTKNSPNPWDAKPDARAGGADTISSANDDPSVLVKNLKNLHTLYSGEKNDENSTRTLQIQLSAALTHGDRKVSLTSGKYDEATVAAVKQYQREHGLQVDGIVGRQTWVSLMSGGKYAAPVGRVEDLKATEIVKTPAAQ